MPSTSNRRKNKKSKWVPKPKPKQVWQVKKPSRNWLELPSDLMVNILQRVGAIDILENAQKVCTAWRKICKDPALWRVINMASFSHPIGRSVCREMCKHAVDRSQGQLVDLTIAGFCNHELIQYVAHRSSRLKRLEIVWDFRDMCAMWSEPLKKLPLLETLGLHGQVSKEDIEAVGRYCPLLKTLKINQEVFGIYECNEDEVAIAIGKNLPELTHLELIGSGIENTGLLAILDGCSHLESLDLRACLSVDLKGDLGKRCLQQIKHLKLPHDLISGYPLGTCDFLNGPYTDDDDDDGYMDYDDDDYGYDGYMDYDDEYDDYVHSHRYLGYADDDEFGGLFNYDDWREINEISEWLAFTNMTE